MTFQFNLNRTDICNTYVIAITVGDGFYTMPPPPYRDATLSICLATLGTVVANAVRFHNDGAAGVLVDTSTDSDFDFRREIHQVGGDPAGQIGDPLGGNIPTMVSIGGGQIVVRTR